VPTSPQKKVSLFLGLDSFSLCETHEFSVSREGDGLAKAILFAAKNNSNVYVQNISGAVELIWKNPTLNIF
jgi:hypothetical protein